MQRRRVLPTLAECELARCCEEGRTAYQTRLRLAAAGVTASQRSVGRWQAEYRRERKESREKEAAEKPKSNPRIRAVFIRTSHQNSITG